MTKSLELISEEREKQIEKFCSELKDKTIIVASNVKELLFGYKKSSRQKPGESMISESYSYIDKFKAITENDDNISNEIKEIIFTNKEFTLNNYVGLVQPDITIIDSDGKMNSRYHIVRNNKGKLYLYDKNLKNIYLKGIYGEKGYDNFSFDEIDGKILLKVGLSGTNYYFQENGEQYFPKTTSEKYEESLDDFTLAKREGFRQLRETAYTPELEKIGDQIDKLVENTKQLSKSIINSLLNKINFTKNPYKKIGENYTDLEEK